MEKINYLITPSLSYVYNDIVSLQKRNEVLINDSLLNNLKNETRYMYFIAKTDNNIPLGFMIVKNAIDVIELEYILVDKEFREKGIGSLLLNEVEKSVKDKNSNTFGINKIMLEVRKSNINAISFYEKNGFVKINERKNYYKDPADHAYIYEKVLKK